MDSPPYPDRADDLDCIHHHCWRWLQAAADGALPALRTATLASVGVDGPGARTVVLRAVQAAGRRLLCYTDVRSAKCVQMQADPRVCWVFYDAERRVQLRLRGSVRLHRDDAVADAHWARVPPHGRRDYLAAALPGAALHAPDAADPAAASTADAGARRWFAVLATHVQCLDYLFLHRLGHQRAGFVYGPNGALENAVWRQP